MRCSAPGASGGHGEPRRPHGAGGGGATRSSPFAPRLTSRLQTAAGKLRGSRPRRPPKAPSGVAGSGCLPAARDAPRLPTLAAGFRRSMRLCRRKSHLGGLRAGLGGGDGGLPAPRAPYEEVVRYQRRASEQHRLVVLVGTSLPAAALRLPLRGSFSTPQCGLVASGVVATAAFFSDSHINTLKKQKTKNIKTPVFYVGVYK